MQAVCRTGNEYAGNCTEHAELAFYYLQEHGRRLRQAAGQPIRIMLINIPPPGDHEFVLVYPADCFDRLPRNMLGYRSEAMICDPWGNIVCSAQRFPSEWRIKMTKWSERGLHIDIDRGPIDPIRFRNIDLENPIIVMEVTVA